MYARFAAAALASAVVVGCGADVAVPDEPESSTALYLIDARFIELATDRVTSNPRIMTLDGGPATISTEWSVPNGTNEQGEVTWAGISQFFEVVVSPCDGMQCVSGAVEIDDRDGPQAWEFDLVIADGDTIAFARDAPEPYRFEVTIARVSNVDGTMANPAPAGDRDAVVTIALE